MSTGEKISAWLAFLGAAFSIAPFVSDSYMDALGDGAFALMFIGATVGLTSFIMIFFFRARNRFRRALLRGQGVLARWRFSQAEWQEFASVEVVRQRENMKMLLIITGVMMLIAEIVIVIADAKASVFVGAILFGVWLLCFIASRFTVAKYQRMAKGPAQEVLIGREALLLGRDLHVWKGWGNRLESCGLTEGPPMQLQIVYSSPNKNSRTETDLRVPVPAGYEAEAASIAQTLAQTAARR